MYVWQVRCEINPSFKIQKRLKLNENSAAACVELARAGLESGWGGSFFYWIYP